jgi:hypothetical protein
VVVDLRRQRERVIELAVVADRGREDVGVRRRLDDAGGVRAELDEAGRVVVVAVELKPDRAQVDDQGDQDRPD